VVNDQGQRLTLGDIRRYPGDAYPLAKALLKKKLQKNLSLNKLPRTQPTLQNTAHKEPSDEHKKPNNLAADELVFSVDGVVCSQDGKEALLVTRLRDIAGTNIGWEWVDMYLLFRETLSMDEWRAECKALEKDPLNLAYKDLLFTEDGHAFNPETGKAFTKEEMREVAKKERPKEWTEDYIAKREQSNGWPREETPSAENARSDKGGAEFKQRSELTGACEMPGGMTAANGGIGDRKTDEQNQFTAGQSNHGFSGAAAVDNGDGNSHMHGPSSGGSQTSTTLMS